jgi:hypothetical protein
LTTREGFASTCRFSSTEYPANNRLIINRTHDGGKTFEPLTKGQPQEHAYDLVYWHALDIDDSAEVLASGSTRDRCG